MKGKSILIVEDEPNIAEVVSLYLERADFKVRVARDGMAAMKILEERIPDLIVLDIMLPEVDGFAITRWLRERSNVPIIMLTARRDEIDRITGLELGADDYVVKPFSPQELVSRVRAVLRRTAQTETHSQEAQPVTAGDLVIEPLSRSATLKGESLTLTAKEFDMLHLFASRPQQVFTRDQLLDQVWGEVEYIDPSTVTVHVRRLREKIEDRPLLPHPVDHRLGRGLQICSGITDENRSLKVSPPPTKYVIGVIAILLISLVVFVLVMNPPMVDFGLMALFLMITAVVSSIVGYAAYRLGWMTRISTLRLTLLISYLISSVLTFFNVWLTARLMFASQHDLLLATVLLLFAGGMAMVLGYFLSSAITDRIFVLQQAAHKLAGGDLETRIEVNGRDEVAQLSQDFNQMAEQLQQATRQRADLIAWVSHDLQTPLTSIQAILEALADGLIEDPEAQERYLRTAQREVRSLSDLIDDLFQLTKLDAGGLTLEICPNSLSDLISDTLESFSQLAEKQNIQLSGQVSDGDRSGRDGCQTDRAGA